jgi:hypothetical protein
MGSTVIRRSRACARVCVPPPKGGEEQPATLAVDDSGAGRKDG